MKITLTTHLDSGAYADVWRGVDEIGRFVAVKLIRPSQAGFSDAVAHAKALARAAHPNVVAVFSVEELEHPDTGERCSAVVMELLDGDTLQRRLSNRAFETSEVLQIGTGIVDAIGHMHSKNMTHNDLHAGNIILCSNGQVKVLDILYFDTLAAASTATRGTRLSRDRRALRLVLQDIIEHSSLEPAVSVEFGRRLSADSTIPEIRQAFVEVVGGARSDATTGVLEWLWDRLLEEEFVDTDDYATALLGRTPSELDESILVRLLESAAMRSEHQSYVRLLWRRLPPAACTRLIHALSVALDRELPNGQWSPYLRMLSAFGPENWHLLDDFVRMRTERLISNDVLTGRHDIHGARVFKRGGGALGSWARSFGPFFVDKASLRDALVSMLRNDWYTQNYVAKYLMDVLPSLVEHRTHRQDLLGAIRSAIANDAKLVHTAIKRLPKDWIAELT